MSPKQLISNSKFRERIVSQLMSVCMFIGCLGIAGYAILTYSLLPLGALTGPEIQQNFNAHKVGIYTHVFAASVAILLGPLQFSKAIRRSYVQLHRWVGRIYLGIGVLVGGLSGMYMSMYAFGGMPAKLGFFLLSVGWLFTGIKGYMAIRQRKIAEHRRWMIFNFSLTLAALMLRIYLPLFSVLGVRFEIAYPIIAWLAWLPNLIVAAWLMRHEKKPDQYAHLNRESHINT